MQLKTHRGVLKTVLENCNYFSFSISPRLCTRARYVLMLVMYFRRVLVSLAGGGGGGVLHIFFAYDISAVLCLMFSATLFPPIK